MVKPEGESAQKHYLTTEECAELMKRSPGAIRNLVMRRAIPFRKPAGRLVFIRSEIEAWIEGAPGLSLDALKAEYRKTGY